MPDIYWEAIEPWVFCGLLFCMVLLNTILLCVLCRKNGKSRHEEELLQQNVYDLYAHMDRHMQQLQTNTQQQFFHNEQRMEMLRATVDAQLVQLRSDNEEKLEKIRLTVEEKLQDSLDRRLRSSYSQVSERLEQMYQSLGEMQALATSVGDIKKMLSNVKTRGVWGEMQLEKLLTEVLTETQFDRNVACVPHSAERVEFAIRLPGKSDHTPVYLPIDSKYPQEAYLRLNEALEGNDGKQIDSAQKAFFTAIKTEAKRIGKYIQPPHTTDFAILFLPLEGLYAQIMSHALFVEELQREFRILIAGPSTLLALLNSLQLGFRTLAIEQRSHEVWDLLGTLKTEFSKFSSVLEATQDKLRQASDGIESAFVRTRSIERKLKKVQQLEGYTPPHAVSEEIR